MNIACIIPAYNEGGRIIKLLRTVTFSNLFSQIIVVDDGSTDNTAAMARLMVGEVDTHVLPTNRGKSFAVWFATQFLATTCTHVCLLDADLVGVTVHDLHMLTDPVWYGTADATFSSRTSYNGLWHLNLDIFTGERVLPLSVLDECKLKDRTSFEMEVLINGVLIDSGARIKVVDWPNVKNPTKSSKYGVWQGVKRDWKMFNEMRKVGGVGKLVRQARDLRRQLV